jgi:hypothetical protein
MKGILADNDVGGHVALIMSIWQSPAWREVWDSLALALYSFADAGLNVEATDADIWHACQKAQIVLITANRNDDGPDSLQATIREHNTAMSLPVLTLGNAKRLVVDKAYARQTAEKALEYLLDIEKYRGVGRLYVP